MNTGPPALFRALQRNTLNEAKRAETEHTFENVATAWFELKKDLVTPAYAEGIWR